MNLARILLDYLRFHPNWFDWETEKEHKPSEEAQKLVREEWNRNSQKRYKIKSILNNSLLRDLPWVNKDDDELIEVVAIALDKWNNGIPPYHMEHDNLRFDIYEWGVKAASIGYKKDTDTLEYVFYEDRPPCYLSNDLTLSGVHHFLKSRILDIRVKKGEEIEYLRKTNGRLQKDHLRIKMYKRYVPIQNKKETNYGKKLL